MPARRTVWLAAGVAIVLVCVTTMGSSGARGTEAIFSDAARATAGPFSAAVLASPTKPTCTIVNAPTRVRFEWSGGTGQYQYTLTNGATLIASGGPTTSTTFTRTLGALDIGTPRFTVQSVYPGSSWVSDPPVTRDYSVLTGLIASCGA